MIDLLIFELLRRKGRVVVPNLGAFFIKEEQFSNDRESGSFTVLFNDSLNFNDGILQGHLKRIEGLSPEEAETQLIAYVNELFAKLEGGDRHIIPNLGYLQMENGVLSFSQTHQPTLDQGISLQEPTEKPLPVSEVSPSADEPVEPVAVEVSPSADEPVEPVVVEVSPSADEPVEPVVVEVSPSADEPVEPVVVEVSPSADEPAEPVVVEVSPSADKPAEPVVAEVPPAMEVSWDRRRKSGKPALTILFILIFAIAATLALAWWFDLIPTRADIYPVNPEPVMQSATETEQSLSDSIGYDEVIVADSLIEADSIVEIQAEPMPQEFDTINYLRENPFHIVAASCATLAIAVEKIESLHEKGYDKSLIINRSEGKYRVSYASYSNRAEATVALEKIRLKENQEDAWLLIHKP
jgi:hypothetical protein